MDDEDMKGHVAVVNLINNYIESLIHVISLAKCQSDYNSYMLEEGKNKDQ